MLAPLLGRQKELARLENYWELAVGGTPQFVVMSGQRRVGKTFLLHHFAVSKRTIWHTGVGDSQNIELGRLADNYRKSELASSEPFLWEFGNWRQALQFVFGQATEKPLLVVIDEFTSIIEGSPSFSAELRDAWDLVAFQREHHLMLVLLDSSITSTERQLKDNAPLYGRATSFNLKPFKLAESLDFLPTTNAKNIVEAYAACGGYPLHLLKWDTEINTEKNLINLAGTPGGILLESARLQLNEFFSRSRGYERVIRALGSDRLSHKKLSNIVTSDLQTVVPVLIKAGVVEHEWPVGKAFEKTNTRLYRLVDPYLRFWYSVVAIHADSIEGGIGESIIKSNLEQFKHHVAQVFEDSCRVHGGKVLQKEGILFNKTGRWWGNIRDASSRMARQIEVDFAAVNLGSELIALGEVAWGSESTEKLETEVLEKAEKLRVRPEGRKFVWSGRQGVSKRAKEVSTYFIDDVVFSEI